MVLAFIAGFGAVFGASEGIRASQAKSRREEHRSRKQNLVVHCPKSSQFSPTLEARQVVLSGDRLFIDTGVAYDQPFGHPFAGYFLAYPEAKYAGLVTTITDEAPIMNWVFVDRETYQFKFGNRLAAEYHHTGPYDCTRQDKRLVFGGYEGFCAVLEDGGFWGLYFDIDGDGLAAKCPGRVVIELELIRRELRTKKPQPPPAPAAPVPVGPAQEQTPPPSPPQEPKQEPEGVPAEQLRQQQREMEEEQEPKKRRGRSRQRRNRTGSPTIITPPPEEDGGKAGAAAQGDRSSSSSSPPTPAPRQRRDDGPPTPPEEPAEAQAEASVTAAVAAAVAEETPEGRKSRLRSEQQRMRGATTQDNIEITLPRLEDLIRSLKYRSPSVEDSDDDERLPPSPDVD